MEDDVDEHLAIVFCSTIYHGCSDDDIIDSSVIDVDDGISAENGDYDDNDPSVGIIDADGDGHSACSTDCDDNDETVFTGAAHLESDDACMKT